MSVANRSNVKMDMIYIEDGDEGHSSQFYCVRREPPPIISVHVHSQEDAAGLPSFLAICAKAHLIFYP